MRFSNLKMRSKLMLGFITILSFMLAVVISSIYMGGKVRHNATLVEQVGLPQALYSMQLDSMIKQLILRMESDSSAGYIGNHEINAALNDEIEKIIVDAKEVFTGRETDLQLIVDIESNYQDVYSVGEQLVQQSINQNWSEVTALMERFSSLNEKLTTSLTVLKDSGLERLQGSMSNIHALSNTTRMTGIYIGLAALLASAAIVLAMSVSIMGPIRKISGLMRSAERGDLTVTYNENRLVKCWERLQCDKKQCGAYESANLRCWQISGTHCQGTIQGDMARKLGNCEQCEVYKSAVNDEFSIIGEAFNNMLIGIGDTFLRFRSSSEKVLNAARQLADLTGIIREGSDQQATTMEGANTSIKEMNANIKDVSGTIDRFYVSAENSSSSITEMSSSIAQVARNSEELSTIFEKTAAAIEQLFSSVKHTAKNVHTLTGNVTEVSSAMTEINTTLKESEKSALSVSSLSDEVSTGIIKNSKEAVKQAIDGINDIHSVVSQSAELIHDLGDKSQDIGHILKVISEVSDQTDLLALNAAIIAAQAGEHGKGFSVVAEEIRELSERTSVSTKEISDLISSIQAGLKKAVDSMERGSKSVGEGVKLIANVDEKLKLVASASEKTSDASRFIVRGTTEQASAIRQVSTSVERMSQMSQELSRAASEQSTTCDMLAKSVMEMNDMALQLKKATLEQSSSADQLSEASHESTSMAERITKATKEEAVESDQIVRAIDSINQIAGNNLTVVSKLKEMVMDLEGQADSLRSELHKFKIADRANGGDRVGA